MEAALLGKLLAQLIDVVSKLGEHFALLLIGLLITSILATEHELEHHDDDGEHAQLRENLVDPRSVGIGGGKEKVAGVSECVNSGTEHSGRQSDHER